MSLRHVIPGPINYKQSAMCFRETDFKRVFVLECCCLLIALTILSCCMAKTRGQNI